MNRHDRRAEEARSRKSFEDYDAVYRKAFRKVDARAIGEGWMRGAKAEALGIAGMVIHPTDAPAPASSAECDIHLSAAYGTQRFDASVRSADLPVLVAQWPAFVEVIRNSPSSGIISKDPRSDARQFIFELIVTNQQYADGTMGSLVASAIAWLAKTSAVGVLLGDSHKNVHYEITDTGPTGRNFRLTMH